MTVIEKPKLPKGMAYVLKTSMLQAALEQAGIDCHVEVRYWTPQSGDSVLEAHYWLPNSHVAFPRVHVRAGVVQGAERRAAQEALAHEILPVFIDWLAQILALPLNSPVLHGVLHFNATYAAGEIDITHSFHS